MDNKGLEKKFARLDKLLPLLGSDLSNEVFEYFEEYIKSRKNISKLASEGNKEDAKSVLDGFNGRWGQFIDRINAKVKMGALPGDVLNVADVLSTLTPEQLDKYGDRASQNTRSFLSGLTFNMYPDMEAAFRKAFGDEDYYKVRDEVKRKLDVYGALNPKSKLITEVGGSLVPAFGFANKASKGAGMINSLMRVFGLPAIAGAVSGFGSTESNEIPDRIVEGIKGAGVGAIAGGAMSGIGTAASPVAKAVWGKLIKASDSVSKSAKREIRRIAELTGKSEETLIDEAMGGAPISANEGVNAALKAFANEGGPAGKFIRDEAKKEAKTRVESVKDRIREGLAPDFHDGNIRKKFDEERELINKYAGGTYEAALTRGSDQVLAPDKLRDEIWSALDRTPKLQGKIEELYRAKGEMPLFLKKEGVIEQMRQPTLRDSEMIMKYFRDRGEYLMDHGEGELGTILNESSKKIRGMIDEASPDMPSARRNWEAHELAKESFKKGSKFPTTKRDFSYEYGALRDKADELKEKAPFLPSEEKYIDPTRAYRAGAATQMDRMLAGKGNTVARFADEMRDEGSILSDMLPNQHGLMEAIENASTMRKLSDDLAARAGSPTQPLQRQQSLSELGPEITIDLLTQGPSVVIPILAKRANRALARGGKVSEKDRMDVAKAMFALSPDRLKYLLESPEDDFKAWVEGVISTKARTASKIAMGAHSGGVVAGGDEYRTKQMPFWWPERLTPNKNIPYRERFHQSVWE